MSNTASECFGSAPLSIRLIELCSTLTALPISSWDQPQDLRRLIASIGVMSPIMHALAHGSKRKIIYRKVLTLGAYTHTVCPTN